LVWSNTAAELLPDFDARVNERVDNWTKLYSRNVFDMAFDMEKLQELIVRDIAVATKLPYMSAEQVLATPRVFGGFGLSDSGTLAVDMTQTPPVVAKADAELIMRANDLADRKLATYMYALAYGTLTAPKIRTAIKRLPREHPGTIPEAIAITVKGKQLPPFKRMENADSFLARQWLSVATDEQLGELLQDAGSPVLQQEGGWTPQTSDALKAEARYYAALESSWTHAVIKEEWKDHTASSPPVDPSTIIRWGEIYGPLFHSIGWSALVFPALMPKLSVGTLKKQRYRWQAILNQTLSVQSWDGMVHMALSYLATDFANPVTWSYFF
jgi:hypothetical protein